MKIGQIYIRIFQGFDCSFSTLYSHHPWSLSAIVLGKQRIMPGSLCWRHSIGWRKLLRDYQNIRSRDSTNKIIVCSYAFLRTRVSWCWIRAEIGKHWVKCLGREIWAFHGNDMFSMTIVNNWKMSLVEFREYFNWGIA